MKKINIQNDLDSQRDIANTIKPRTEVIESISHAKSTKKEELENHKAEPEKNNKKNRQTQRDT